MSLRPVPNVQSSAQSRIQHVLSVANRQASVNAVTREMLGVGVTMSSSNTRQEWKEDITRILDMFVSRGFEGSVELLERTDSGFDTTKISIAVSKNEISIVNGYETLKTHRVADRRKLIGFLETYIIDVLRLKLVETVFRTFD